jgi:hypothetical protein
LSDFAAGALDRQVDALSEQGRDRDLPLENTTYSSNGTT